MAGSLRQKRQRTSRLADMTTDELRKMIESSVERKLIQMFKDPDEGLTLRPEFVESLWRQEKEFAAGKRGKPLDEVAARLGLD